MRRDYKLSVMNALRSFERRNKNRQYVCDCGAAFAEKHRLYRHLATNRCVPAADAVTPPQLDLFGGK